MDADVLGWLVRNIVPEINAFTLIVALIIGLVAYLFIRYFVMPLDWRKEMDGSGYCFLEGNGHRRLHRVNAIRRNRKIGEIAPVFPNGWFMLAESQEVHANRPHHVSALGEDFALFRGSDGKVHVLDAYCPHLGANMAIGGRVVGDCLECPFHRWQFSGLDGKCTKVPYSEKVPKFAEVKKWKALEVNYMIFVWFHAEGDEPTWQPDKIPEIGSGKYIFRGRNEFLINTHIQEIPENGSDLWHFNSVHGTNAVFGPNITVNNSTWLKFFQHVWESDWEPSQDPMTKHVGTSKLSHHISVFGLKLASMDIDIRQLGPGYVELKFTTPFGPMVILQSVTPVEPLIQKVIHRVYTPWYLALYGNFLIIGESLMIERDIMIWNNKKYLDKPLLVKEDKALLKYRRWFAQFYSPNSPTYSSVKRSLEW